MKPTNLNELLVDVFLYHMRSVALCLDCTPSGRLEAIVRHLLSAPSESTNSKSRRLQLDDVCSSFWPRLRIKFLKNGVEKFLKEGLKVRLKERLKSNITA